MILHEAVDQWTRWMRTEPLAERTRQAYFAAVSGLERVLEDIEVEEIGHATLRQVIENLSDRGLAPRTINVRIAAWRAFFAWAVSEHLVEADPTAGLKLQRVIHTERRWLTVPEARAITEAWKWNLKRGNGILHQTNMRRHAAMHLLYHLGLRVAELRDLKKTDIDWQTGKVLVMGKGSKQRTLFMNQTCSSAVESWIHKNSWTSKSPYVLSRAGRPLSTNGIADIVMASAVKAGLEESREEMMKRPRDQHITPHVLRHSCCAHLINGGMPLPRVRDWMGHTDIATTMLYDHSEDGDLVKASNILGGYGGDTGSHDGGDQTEDQDDDD